MRRLIGWAGTLIFTCILCYGQVTTGTIDVTVTDSSGLVVPGAAVTAINLGTSALLRARTGQSGRCQFPPVRPGRYRLVVEQTGFQKLVRDEVIVNATETVRLDFRLAIGAVSETITVADRRRCCKANGRPWGTWWSG